MGVVGSLPIAAALTAFTKKKIEDTIPASLLLTVLLVYLGGLVTNLSIACTFVWIVSGLATIYAAISLIFHRISLNDIFTCGLVAYLIMIVFFAITSIGREFYDHDDLNYWGLSVKELYYNDHLKSSWIIKNLIHPPIVPLLNLFGTRAWPRYSESMCFIAQNTFCAGMMMPLFSKIKGKNKSFQFLCLLLSVLLIPITLQDTVYSYLNVDALLGLVIAYAINSFLDVIREEFVLAKWIPSAIALTVAVLAKRIAPIIVALLLAVMAFGITYKYQDFTKKQIDKKVWQTLLLFVAFIEFALISWNGFSGQVLIVIAAVIGGYIAALAFEIYESSSDARKELYVELLIILIIVVVVAASAVIFASSKFAVPVIVEFARKVIGKEALISDNTIDISLFTLLIISATGGYFYFRDRAERKFEWVIHNLILIATIVFLFALLYVYVGILSASSFSGVPSFSRYVCPFIAVIIMFWVREAIVCSKEDSTRRILGVLIALVLFGNAYALLFYMTNRWEGTRFYAFDQAGISLNAHDKVYLIDETTEYPYMDAAFRYEIYPAECNMDAGLLSDLIKSPNYVYPTWQEVRSELICNDYTYVYLQTIDDKFVDMYGQLFSRTEDIKPGNVYKVQKDGDEVKLVLL